jgi:phage anti-repressor protein
MDDLTKAAGKTAELINIVEQDDRQAVSARELHKALGVGKRFATWIRDRIEKYGFVEGDDYTISYGLSSPDSANPKSRAQETIDYLLSVGTAKEITMVENNEKGREIRRRLIEIEKAWNSPKSIVDRAMQIINATNSYAAVPKDIRKAFREIDNAMWEELSDCDGRVKAGKRLVERAKAYRNCVNTYLSELDVRMIRYHGLLGKAVFLERRLGITDAEATKQYFDYRDEIGEEWWRLGDAITPLLSPSLTLSD